MKGDGPDCSLSGMKDCSFLAGSRPPWTFRGDPWRAEVYHGQPVGQPWSGVERVDGEFRQSMAPALVVPGNSEKPKREAGPKTRLKEGRCP